MGKSEDEMKGESERGERKGIEYAMIPREYEKV